MTREILPMMNVRYHKNHDIDKNKEIQKAIRRKIVGTIKVAYRERIAQ